MPAAPIDEMSTATRWTVAVHEAGHATAIAVLRPGALLSASIAVRPADKSIGGVEWRAQTKGQHDRHLTREHLTNRALELLAGRAAEVVILGEPSAGAGGAPDSDLAQVTWLLTALVASLGMGGARRDPPGLWRGMPPIERVPEFLALNPDVMARAADLMVDLYGRAVRLIEEHRATTERVARVLAARGAVTGAEVDSMVAEARADQEKSGRLRNGARLAASHGTVIALPPKGKHV